jgi:uncharacterized alkaline shock family protein YloU
MVRIADKLLLFIYSLVVGIISFYMILLSFQWISDDAAEEFINLVQEVVWIQLTAASLAILFILISIRVLYLALRSGSGIPPSIDQRSDYGDIRISMETVENLSLKAASRVRGTKDIKARVQVNEAGLEITIRTIVDGENSIPELTEEIQRTVKEHIEDITGIPVASVSVFVANIIQSQSFKSRVE